MHRTHLADAHEAANARMVDFSGWHLPVQYSGILAEHNAVRKDCGIFDTCHMGRLIVRGDEAAKHLSSAITVDTEAMIDGRCRYGLMLNNDGGIVDDLIVYRVSDSEFMLVVNSATHDNDLAHIKALMPEHIAIEDIGPSTAKIDIQGPTSPEVMAAVLGEDLSGLNYFRFQRLQYADEPATVSRTGYTGETGFEIYLPAETCAAFWSAAVSHGALPCGLGARDTLRLEAGLPLYGHELSEERTPIEAGMMRYVDLSREFVGAAALRAQAGKQPDAELTAFTIDGRQSARHGNSAVLNDEAIGSVTSGSFAPTVGRSIGFAYLNTKRLGTTKAFGIDNGRKILNASVAEAPFYKRQ